MFGRCWRLAGAVVAWLCAAGRLGVSNLRRGRVYHELPSVPGRERAARESP